MQLVHCTVAVAGGSLAGLRAAIAAREAGADVLVVSKGISGRSGAAAVASSHLAGPSYGEDDSPALFANDTLVAGHGLNDPALVHVVVEEAGARAEELHRFGVRLLTVDGRIDRVRVPGHSRPRGVMVAPDPGLPPGVALTLPLRQYAERIGVRCRDRCQVIDLWLHDGQVMGLLAVDLNSGEPLLVAAGAVVLASGGGSYLYARTNGTSDVTGDGYGLAVRAGARLRDMEFVQFHPTRLDSPISRMMTEALIDDGAVLRDRHGEEFMYRYHPEGSMAPRDFRCRGIYAEVQKGNGVDGYALLDCSRIPPERLQLRHAALTELLQRHGVDFPREQLRVSPACHFFMGGVAIGVDGATGVPGLYACGEVTGGVHGANRVGNMAFTEALVFGNRAGAAAAAFARSQGGAAAAAFSAPALPPYLRPALVADLPPENGASGGSGGGGPARSGGSPALKEAWRELRQLMWDRAGLLRTSAQLQEGLAGLAGLRRSVAWRPANWQEAAALGMLDLSLVAAASVLTAAITREESRGAHWRADFPAAAEQWKGNVFLGLRADGWQAEFVPL